MQLRRELSAISMPFRISSDSESDNRTSITSTKDEKKKKKKTTKIKESPEEMCRDEQRERLFMRPGVIDEEPDSMDSIISNPSAFPITIVPSPTAGGCGMLIRSTTAQSSVSRLSRLSSSSK